MGGIPEALLASPLPAAYGCRAPGSCLPGWEESWDLGCLKSTPSLWVSNPSLWLLREGHPPSGADAVKQGVVLKFSVAEELHAFSGRQGETQKPTMVQAVNTFLKGWCFLFYCILVCCLTKPGTTLLQKEFHFQLAFWL